MLYTSPNSNLSSVLGTSPEDIDTSKNGSDRFLLVAVLALMTVGVLSVYTSIAFFAEENGSTPFALAFGHTMKVGIAFIIMLITSKINYHTLAKLSYIGMGISWVLLVAVMIFGTETFGAKRWLNVGGFSFQPSSVATVALLIHVSVLLSEKQAYIKDFKRSFLPILMWIFVTCGLIGIEDFSTAGILAALCLVLMFIGRISTIQLGGMVVLAVLGGLLLIGQSDNRQSRIDQYIEQIKDIKSDEFMLEEGYQTQQAHIAIAQGRITGVGFGKSTQRDFLPAPYNDFIFAIIAEEHGIIGASVLLIIFIAILYRGIAVIARRAEDILGTLLAVACTLTIVVYAFVNAAVASGLLPVTGLPMPFVSYGGTSMLFSGIMVGILLNISKHTKDRKAVFYA